MAAPHAFPATWDEAAAETTAVSALPQCDVNPLAAARPVSECGRFLPLAPPASKSYDSHGPPFAVSQLHIDVHPSADVQPTDVPVAAAAAVLLPPEGLEKPNVPPMSLWDIFRMFLGFGSRAFGGPVAQMAAMKQAFVTEQKWITVQRFNRVVSVYQALPGPEATELACYFGLLAGGRPGAFLAGLGFLLPGFVLMTLAAWAYVTFGQTNTAITQALSVISVAVTAMVFRAVHKIGLDNITDHGSGAVHVGLAAAAAIAAVESVMNVNFFIILLHCGILWGCFLQPGRNVLGAAWAGVPLVGFVAYVATKGPFSELIPLGVGAGELGRNPATIFLVGLLGGLLTFGGAYTAIPFMRFETVISGGWLTNQQFLDSLAVGQCLPSPLVMFSCFVGFLSGGFGGALLMTLGMFLPAFSFTLIGHEFFERIVESKGSIAHLLDGISAAVAGLIAVTAVQLLKAAVQKPTDAVIFTGSLAILYTSKHRYTSIFLVCAAVLAGFIFATPADASAR